MPVWRMQCAAAADNTFPVDQIVITPHFNDSGVGTDPEGLATDLANVLNTYYVGTRQINVKAYDAQGTPPVYPQADVTINAGVAPASSIQRETAICLSYFAGQNRPRYRGRLYISNALIGQAAGGARPSAPAMQKVADLVQPLVDLGGADVQWVVYSRVDDAARQVTNWWVDNAWDTQRSRGLRATSRLEGTTEG